MKRPSAEQESEKEDNNEKDGQEEDIEEEEMEQDEIEQAVLPVESPFKRPASKGAKKQKSGEQKENVDTKRVQAPKAKAKQAAGSKKKEKPKKEKVNIIEEHTFPNGWQYAEIETAKGRRYKRYTSPQGHQHFSKKLAKQVGYDENNK